MRFVALAAFAALCLSACTALQGVPPQLEQAAGAPSMISAAIIVHEQSDINQVKSAVCP